ncbi:MAG TPA: NUDIX hydrolase [Actinoplanes sp.]|nr:NUDIX hydrolase [Actinoplanes sp.]
MTDSMSLPPAMAQRAREFTGPPAPARPSATVVLLRPHDDTFQVYVLRRATTMAFGGLYAFPGGVVDLSDKGVIGLSGPPALDTTTGPAITEQPPPEAVATEQALPGGTVDPADHPVTIRTDWPERLGLPPAEAHAVVGAAARELFEETGVLLAGPRAEPDRTVTATDTPEWEAERAAVQARTLSMTDLLARHELRLRDDLLLPWSRWITPEFEPRRYDTWFFVALLPEAQSARDVSGEASTTAWIPPAETSLPMLPPTRRTLTEIAAHHTIPEVVAASAHRDAATALTPRIEIAPNGEARLQLP